MKASDTHALYYCKRKIYSRYKGVTKEFLFYYNPQTDIWAEILDDAEKRGLEITRLSTEELDEGNTLYYLNEGKITFYSLRKK